MHKDSMDFQKFIKTNKTLSKMDALISGCDSPFTSEMIFFLIFTYFIFGCAGSSLLHTGFL